MLVVVFLVLASLATATATVHVVQVGPESAAVSFVPNDMTVAMGDVVSFVFLSVGHTVDSTSAVDGCDLTPSFSTGPFPINTLPFVWNLSVSLSHGFSPGAVVPYACQPHCECCFMTALLRVASANVSATTALSSSSPPPSPPPSTPPVVPGQIVVSVGPNGDNIFAPYQINVRMGDVVRFEFHGGHTVDATAHLNGCDYVGLFSSGFHGDGFVYLLEISQVNGFAPNRTVPYACKPHCQLGMWGAIVVTDGGAGTPPPLPTPPAPRMPLYILLHAVGMSVAFGLLMPLAFVFATFAFPPFWFHVHWVIMTLATVLAAASFALIVLYVGDPDGGHGFHFWNIPGSPTKDVHPSLGLFLMVLVVLQILVGIVADRVWRRGFAERQGLVLPPPSLWDYVHRWSGRLIIVLGVLQMLLGVVESGALLPRAVWGVFGGWFGAVAVVLLLLWGCGALRLRSAAPADHAPLTDKTEPVINLQYTAI